MGYQHAYRHETPRPYPRPSSDGQLPPMPCLLLLLLLAFPRLGLAILFFFTHYLDRAFHSILVLILGFLFLPLTTLAYAWMINSHLPVEGINLVWLLLAALVDVGAL